MSMRAMTVVAAFMAMLLVGCSRERIDWKSAESADTVEAYSHFLERHPDGELATQATTRIAQLNEDKDWQKAATADSADGYKQFLTDHPSGKWAEEARIRVDNFSLDSNPSPIAQAKADAAAEAARAPTPAVTATQPDPTPQASAQSRAVPPPPGPASKPAPMPVQPAPASQAAHANGPTHAASGEAAVPAARATQPTAAAKVASKGEAAAPAAHASTPATAAAPTDASSFGIQLGAFSSQAAALGEWKRLQSNFEPQLHGLFAHAVAVKGASGTLYRLQSPVGQEARARGICSALAQKSQPCVVVLPQH